MERADLHFHSLASDGKHSVEELKLWLDEAYESGLRLAVLTDHDGIDAFDQFSSATSRLWPSVRACELSTELVIGSGKRVELHLLIYGIEPSDSYLQKVFDRFRVERETRYFQICERIEAKGFAIATQEVAKEHKGVLGRPHVADALIRAKVVKNRKEAFDRFLYNGSSYLVEKWKVSLFDALDHCREMGYRSSIAHPGIYGIEFKDLEYLKVKGLDAVEVIHPKHTPTQQKSYREMAVALGLFQTGGSDFHDASSDQLKNLPSLGQAPYSLEMAESFLEAIL